MSDAWVNQSALRDRLSLFFDQNRDNLGLFGRTVNQTFEAFVFAATAAWYRERGWDIQFVHPRSRDSSVKPLRLKFSTRGRPENYTYVVCLKNGDSRQIRHQLRVATSAHKAGNERNANVCLDVAIITPFDLSTFGTDNYVENSILVGFAEAKHMSAFAELVANFIGLVHELQPGRLIQIRTDEFKSKMRQDPAPFLYVSGFLYRTALGIVETIEQRGYDIDVYSKTKSLSTGMKIEESDAKRD
jgi:hypothetical protein